MVDWWRQVAERYQFYSHLLSFDIVIEVTDALAKNGPMLNKLYANVVPVIRKTNPTRIIFLSPRLRSDPDYLSELKFPSTDYMMAEWHFYAAGPSKINKEKLWTTGTEAEKNIIRGKIKTAMNWQALNKIYTWVGAWMASNYNADNTEPKYNVTEQIAFANFVTCELTKNKVPFAFNADNVYYDRDNGVWFQDLKPVFDEIMKTNC